MSHGEKVATRVSQDSEVASEPTDRDLLARFCEGEDAAFAVLIERHGPMVLGVCRRVLHQQQDAEDAFQTTFLVLVRRAGSLNRPELLGNWLYGVAYRTAQKARARLARQHLAREQVARLHPPEKRVDAMSSSDPHTDLHWQELRTVLDRELKELPAKYRTPLILCYLEGMTNEQAARWLGWPAGSMSYRLARGRQMLRDRLEARRRQMSALAVSVFLTENAAPADLPGELAKNTLQLALQAVNRPVLPLPPLGADAPGKPPVAEPAASMASHWHTGWRRGMVALAALLAVGAAGAAAYPSITTWMGGAGASASTQVAPGDNNTGSVTPTPAAGCHTP